MLACLPVTRPVRATEPTFAQEPLTLVDAKRQCGIAQEVSQHDEQLSMFITAARQEVERDASLVCYTGTFTWKMTEFPCRDWFELPDIRPVTSITSIVYVASDGTSTTWGGSNYSLETSALNPYVRLAYGQVWPTVRGDIGGITVTFVAGYASVSLIPAKVKYAVQQMVHIKHLESIGGDIREIEQRAASYRRQIQVLKSETYS